MQKLSLDSLMTLEAYAKARKDFRAKVLAHKRPRTLHLGQHLTIIFEEHGIQEEIDAYNPLIPDGRNFKATMMIEYEDEAERRAALAKLKGIEDKAWVRVAGHSPVYAIADEDLERETDEKTSSVHFLRFELDEAMARDLKDGSSLSIGVDHPHYHAALDPVSASLRTSLSQDLD